MKTTYRDLFALCRAMAVSGLLVSMLAAPGLAAENVPPHRGPPAAGRVYPLPGTWCANYRLGQLSGRKRLEGTNLERLRAAQAEIAPGFETRGARTGINLLASYQEEVERRLPNFELASTYLAMASAIPVTFAVLRRVNALLCVSTTRTHARTIVTATEATRRQLAQ